ncbi:unnamed protein product, partial [Amoebophrya sp. A25]
RIVDFPTQADAIIRKSAPTAGHGGESGSSPTGAAQDSSASLVPSPHKKMERMLALPAVHQLPPGRPDPDMSLQGSCGIANWNSLIANRHAETLQEPAAASHPRREVEPNPNRYASMAGAETTMSSRFLGSVRGTPATAAPPQMIPNLIDDQISRAMARVRSGRLPESFFEASRVRAERVPDADFLAARERAIG